MPCKEQYLRYKKPCPSCGNLIARTSSNCFPCSRIKMRKYSRNENLSYRQYTLTRFRTIGKNLRDRVFEKLGDKCVRCGFSDKRALHFDHINNDGYIDRKQNGWNTPRHRYTAILNDTEGRFQVLCANCNFIKKHEEIQKRNALIYAV